MEAIIFDFDGVIAESVDVKTRAFREMFENHPDDVEEIVQFHVENGGMSRFEKFRHIYKTILKKDLTPENFHNLCRRFNAIVVDRVITAPYVTGALEALETLHRRFPLYIASGTPKSEIREIVQRRGIGHYFSGVFGSPEDKTTLVTNILRYNGYDPSKVVFIGDSKNDYEAAVNTGVVFIARVLDGYQVWTSSPGIKALIKDLRTIEKHIN